MRTGDRSPWRVERRSIRLFTTATRHWTRTLQNCSNARQMCLPPRCCFRAKVLPRKLTNLLRYQGSDGPCREIRRIEIRYFPALRYDKPICLLPDCSGASCGDGRPVHSRNQACSRVDDVPCAFRCDSIRYLSKPQSHPWPHGPVRPINKRKKKNDDGETKDQAQGSKRQYS
jgi:hypothetical protein